MSRKIKHVLPVLASAEFEIEAPENWDEMDDEEKIEYFLEHANPTNRISSVAAGCQHAVTGIQCDGEIDFDDMNRGYTDSESFVADFEEIE